MFLEYFGLDGLGDLPAVEDFADVATAVEDAHAALWGDDDAEDGSEVPEPEGAGAAITETAITETAIAGPVIAETAIAETEGAETEGEERFAAR
jgi:hypothetical protein